MDPARLDSTFRAFLRDIAYQVFRKVACELENNGSYDWLRCEVNTIAESKEKECQLNVNLKIWSELAERLSDSQKAFEDEFQALKEKQLREIARLDAQIDSSYCINNEKLDYVSRLEAAKLQQQNQRLAMKEQAVAEKLKELEKTKRTDAKVSQQLNAYGRLTIENFEEEIAAWTIKYNNELERRTQETNDIQERIDEIQEFLEESRDLQKERQLYIDEYNEEQRKIQDQLEYWNEVHKAATMIQAIWKGYMVRNKLGPYAILAEYAKMKPRKSKKNKNKNKKKKKKD